MTAHFTSEGQQKLFTGLHRTLELLGYRSELIKSDYRFPDWFSPDNIERVAPLAAFGQTPLSYNSACIGILKRNGNGKTGKDLIADYRALGAPFAFEVADDHITPWVVGRSHETSVPFASFNLSELPTAIERSRNSYLPTSVLRGKNLANHVDNQRTFFDAGLIPAIESHIRQKLDPLLSETLKDAKRDYRQRHGSYPSEQGLFRLLFRALTGKVMHDRGLPKLSSLTANSASKILEIVAAHYNEHREITPDAQTQQIVVERLWGGLNFANLSVDVLAYVWENTLVSDAMRETQSIHATPPNVARFLTQTLIDVLPDSQRTVVEPCCGSGTLLVAALEQLRALLSPDVPPPERHDYFASVLRGFDTESFGLEVAQSALLIADFPNHNGWQIDREDVFSTAVKAPKFIASLKAARFVLCNPPFLDFDDNQRLQYKPNYIEPPAELLSRVLDNIPEDAEIGFVLPYKAIDGNAYRPIRRRLAKRFSDLRVVSLPEKVFANANFPTALVVARDPKQNGDTSLVTFSEAASASEFLDTGKIARTEVVSKDVGEIGRSLAAIKCASVWRFLSSYEPLSSAVTGIARGVEWETFDSTKQISANPKRGFVAGFHKSKQMQCFEAPDVAFLDARRDNRKYKAWDRPWHLPKVICNAVRKSKGPWKIACCAVELNLYCTQNFTVMWPTPPWTSRTLAAVLNGPVACGYMASHESWKHLTKENFGSLPLPRIADDELSTLESLVSEYETIASIKRDEFIMDMSAIDSRLRTLLMWIDGVVFRSYSLPTSLAEQVLELFAGKRRPSAVEYPIDKLLKLRGSPPSRTEREDSALLDVSQRAMLEQRV